MTRNWNTIRAKLTDPFDPDNEEVEQQIQAMMAKQDAQGGHIYPEFHLPNSLTIFVAVLQPASKSSGPAESSSHLSERHIPTRARSTETTSSTRKAGYSPEVSPSKRRKSAKLRNDPDSLASKLDSALTASKRAAFGRRKDLARQRDTQNSYTDTNASKLDQPFRGSKRKADDANHDEKRGREAKRRIGPDGRPTAAPSEDYLDY